MPTSPCERRTMRHDDEGDEPGFEMAVGQPLLTVALDRLITSETLERVRATICEEAATLARADAVFLFEASEGSAPDSLELTCTRGPADNAIDTYALSRRLAVEAVVFGSAQSSCDDFYHAELERLAAEWRVGGRLCLAYPLRGNDETVGALAIVCLGRGRLADRDRWAIRRFHQPAAAKLADARGRMELRALADTDPLTGLTNRRGLEDAILDAGGGYGLIMVDFDELKKLNDEAGYHVGDQVLVAIGAALQAEARPGERAARLGGDEFMLLVPRTTLHDLEERAEVLAQRLDRLDVPPDALGLYHGASVGVALAAADEDSADLIERASTEMRSRKRRRKTDRRA